MNKIDYEGMGSYYGKSARTMMRYEEDKPQKFQMMLEEYLQQLEPTDSSKNNSESEVIVFASLKGGVGKSTMSDSFGYYLDESVVLNLDISQPSKNINSCPTLDYINYIGKHTVGELVQELSKKYKYIIIDTPGEVTSEVLEAVALTNKVVIPMTIGKRAREKTEKTLEAFFGTGAKGSGEYKIYFLFNISSNRKKRDESVFKFKEMYGAFVPDANIKIKAALGAMDYSDAISTAEEEGQSVFSLAETNRLAYKSVLAKITKVCGQIEKHFEL